MNAENKKQEELSLSDKEVIMVGFKVYPEEDVKEFIKQILNPLKRKRRWTREEIKEIVLNKAGDKLK